jgi:hypothetical protein
MKTAAFAILLSIILPSCAMKVSADGSRESTLDGAYVIRAMEIISEK